MKNSGGDAKGKGRIRSLDRKGTGTGKSATVAAGKPTGRGARVGPLEGAHVFPPVIAVQRLDTAVAPRHPGGPVKRLCPAIQHGRWRAGSWRAALPRRGAQIVPLCC